MLKYKHLLFILIVFVSFYLIESNKRSYEQYGHLYKDPHFTKGRFGIVHLFEWPFHEIASECQDFFQKHAYGGVQVSPITEHLVLPNRPWHERYSIVSYEIISRLGDETKFKEMVEKCNEVGVRVFVEVVLNNMSGSTGTTKTTGNSKPNINELNYPEVGYKEQDFNEPCDIKDDRDAKQVRNCEIRILQDLDKECLTTQSSTTAKTEPAKVRTLLVDFQQMEKHQAKGNEVRCEEARLHDLDQSSYNVRYKILNFLNLLISFGVAGFRMTSARHMWPSDLNYIYTQLDDLNTKYFPAKSRPFIYQEVVDFGLKLASNFNDYTSFGRVMDYKYCMHVGQAFNHITKLASLKHFGPNANWQIGNTLESVVFVETHETQRGVAGNNVDGLLRSLTVDNKGFKMGTAFMLSWPLGIPIILSGFSYSGDTQGPPSNFETDVISEIIRKEDLSCENAWTCEHRWRQVYNMVSFSTVIQGESVEHWWTNGEHQIAYCLGNKGFIAFNNHSNLPLRLMNHYVCLPPGKYCERMSGVLGEKTQECTGEQPKIIEVREGGLADIVMEENDIHGVIAIDILAKFGNKNEL